MLRVFLVLLLLPVQLSAQAAGTINVTWTVPTIREDGTPFAPGEFQGTRVTYYRKSNDVNTYDVDGESIRISNLKKGWWNVYAQSMSLCERVEDRDGESFFTTRCLSEPTPTIRVRVR